MTRLEVAGTLRCTNTGDWQLLSDAAHVPIGGLTLLQQTSTYLKVGFDPADQIHTFIVAPDETLAKAGIFGGRASAWTTRSSTCAARRGSSIRRCAPTRARTCGSTGCSPLSTTARRHSQEFVGEVQERETLMTGPNFPVPEPVQKATKAIAATVTTVSGVVALAVTSIADGSISWDEGGKLLGALAVAAATIYGVWKVENKPKGDA